MKQKKLGRIKFSYLAILILTGFLVVPPHLFPQPYFMILRFPHYLEKMPPLFGISWPFSFQIYHLVILSLVAIGLFNILGLTFSSFKQAARISSFIGLLFFSLIALFFLFIFIKVNPATALIYGSYSLVLFGVNLWTLMWLKNQTN